VSGATPITPEQRLAEIRQRNEVRLSLAEDPAWPLRQADVDRHALLAEVNRLNARVAELTSLLNDPDRLAVHALELRAIYAEADADAERDRLADGGDL
jgi:hypothetical protein